MGNRDLPLPDLVGRAYARAVPAKRFVRLARDWLEQRGHSGKVADGIVADALLQHLVSPYTPALLLSYLSQAVSSTLTTARTVVVHLLFLLGDREVPSHPALASIFDVILANPSGLDMGDTIPSTLEKPHIPPDIGTSASASPIPAFEAVSTLALLLPLLRICSLSAPYPAPTPIVTLTTRLLALLEPYPAPSLNVGLEAGGLLQSLPEALAAPLRDCLSGLMADLAISQDAAQLHITPATDIAVRPPQSARVLPPSLASSTSVLPSPQALEFLLAYLHRSAGWTRHPGHSQDPPIPPANHIQLIRLGPHIASDPSTFLVHLIQAAVNDWGGTYNGGSPEGLPSWLFLTESLPVLLSWWKENPELKWMFPSTLLAALATAFDTHNVRMAGDDAWLSSAYDLLLARADGDDESGGFVQPDGWMLSSLEVTILRRMVELGLLDQNEASGLLQNVSMPPSGFGESLMNRLANAAKGHVIPLAHLITFAPGAARSFSYEVIVCIRACPGTPPPDGLFTNLASRPSLLSCLSVNLTPPELLEVLVEHLLDPPDDLSARNDDPQGSLTRFGEGVVLVEAVVAHFVLPLPHLLRDARKALSLADLDKSQRSNLNGWIKALFGSDGIDDQILLTTSPHDFCRLACGLFQQGIFAAMAGQIDLDTLHSGLSYFAQPLLSWCLGGIVTWLCTEIERNGMLSALHLDVLQTLLLESCIPEPLLRVTWRSIKALLEPSAGLGPVLQSSKFDMTAVRERLGVVSVTPNSLSASSSRPLIELRAELQSTRRPDLRQPAWAEHLLDTFASALSGDGVFPILELILSEVFQTSTVDLEGRTGDPLAHFAVLMLVLRIASVAYNPLLVPLIDDFLPILFRSSHTILANLVQPETTVFATSSLARLIKQSLLAGVDLYSATDSGGFSTALVEHLIDDLTDQRSRPDMVPGVQMAKKARKAGRERLTEVQRGVIAGLCELLGCDGEMRDRWPRLDELLSNS